MSMQEMPIYDLEMFAPREPRIREVTPKTQKTKRRHSRLRSFLLVSLVLAVTLVGALIAGSFIFMRAQITEVNDQISDLHESLQDEQGETSRLQNQLAELTSAEQVETYAQTHNMHLLEPDQIKYITVEQGDKVEVWTQPEKTLWEKLLEG